MVVYRRLLSPRYLVALLFTELRSDEQAVPPVGFRRGSSAVDRQIKLERPR